MTIVISSHILEELSKIATDYGIIHQGSLLEEITRDELMKKCSERLEITSPNPEKIVPVLDRLGYRKYQITDREHISIFEHLDQSDKLNAELVRAGSPIRELKVNSEKLETYYLNQTGGEHHA